MRLEKWQILDGDSKQNPRITVQIFCKEREMTRYTEKQQILHTPKN